MEGYVNLPYLLHDMKPPGLKGQIVKRLVSQPLNTNPAYAGSFLRRLFVSSFHGIQNNDQQNIDFVK